MRQIDQYGEDARPDSTTSQIIEGAFGIPQALDAAPTSANNILPRTGASGYYASNLYIRLGEFTYRLTMTQV